MLSHIFKFVIENGKEIYRSLRTTILLLYLSFFFFFNTIIEIYCLVLSLNLLFIQKKCIKTFFLAGSTAGGQTVTVTGSGFDGTTAVTICGQTCTKDSTASQTASQFVCMTPPATSM